MDAVARTSAAVMKAGSLLRGRRLLHPAGTAYTAVVHVSPDPPVRVPLTATPRQLDAVVRFSRGGGLPEPLPDVLGLALRVLDADGVGGCQDLMLATGGRDRVRRHLLWPARNWLGATYSSLLSYDAGGRSVVVAALPEPGRVAHSPDGPQARC